MSKYNKITALYSRLSVGDEDRDGGESNSIQNQRIFLEQYAQQHHLINIKHYVDDDESGRFFDRPAYSAMIEDVRNGKIGTIIIKDMTRWGRDYLEVGNAMELMRIQQVRFIAINSGIDSAEPSTLEFYCFADTNLEITLEIYLRENPGKTENDFIELKTLSDSIYLEQDREEYRQTWKNVSLHGLDETEFCSVPSSEDAIIEQIEQAVKQKRRRELAHQALCTLTDVQRRRYLLYHVNGLTMREIADIEGVVHSKIQKSLEAAEKKIKKFLSEC